MTAGFPSIDRLLPHRGCMLLLDRVVAAGEDRLRAAAVVGGETWYADADQGMPAWVGMELMAQAVAAYVGLECHRRGEPVKMGFLLGSRAYRARVLAFARGQALEIEAVLSYREANGLGAFDCRILDRDSVLAEATIKVYEPDDPGRLMDWAP